MNITAYYTRRDGAGCVHSGVGYSEALKLLKGGYRATEARIESDGVVIGERLKRDGAWRWWLDTDYFEVDVK